MTTGINELGQFYAQVATIVEGCDNITLHDKTKLKDISDAFLSPKNLQVGEK